MVERVRQTLDPEVEGISTSQVLTPTEFIIDWRASAKKARRRVWLECMNFQKGHAPSLVQQVLFEASDNGLDVRANIDAFSDETFNAMPVWFPTFGKKGEQTLRALDRKMKVDLKESKVKVTTVNPDSKRFGLKIPAKIAPFMGRNHVKIYIIDDVVWFGGINISPEAFENADLVVRFEDPEIVKALSELFTQVNENRPTSDYRKTINSDYTLLVDRGDSGKSLILDEAKEMVSASNEKIEYLSFSPPGGEMLKEIMERAKNGVRVDIVLSKMSQYESDGSPVGFWLNRKFKKFSEKISRIENIYVFHYPEGNVHGKLLIVDGKTALFGSHNFAELGVVFGTQEASIETTDSSLILQLQQTINSIKDGSFDRGLKRD